MAQHFFYPQQSASISIPNPLPVTGPLTDAQLRATPVPVSISSGITNPLPVTDAAAEASLSSIDTKLTSQATAAKQDIGNTSLASIDGKLTAPLSVTGPLTDAQLRASAVPVSAATLPLPAGAATEATLAAFSAKSAGALVPAAFDYIALTYTGSNVTSAVYKTGGAGGSTVATLTLAYTGSQLDSVTKT